jgi:transcriptional regulator with XRE-family HTH domain
MDFGAAQSALGTAIRELRAHRGLSQEELAFECGLHRTYIGSVERGERNISLSNLIRIAAALRTRASELLALASL